MVSFEVRPMLEWETGEKEETCDSNGRLAGKCAETGCQWKSDDFPISLLPVSSSMKFFNRNSARVQIGCHSGVPMYVMDQPAAIPSTWEPNYCRHRSYSRSAGKG